MPLFEFQCQKCGQRFEELMSTDELATVRVKCPACGSHRAEREFSAFATGSGSAGDLGGGQTGGCGSGGFT